MVVAWGGKAAARRKDAGEEQERQGSERHGVAASGSVGSGPGWTREWAAWPPVVLGRECPGELKGWRDVARRPETPDPGKSMPLLCLSEAPPHASDGTEHGELPPEDPVLPEQVKMIWLQ